MTNVREKARKSKKSVRKQDGPERVPFGSARQKMQLSDEEQKVFKARGMNPYWFTDRDGRIPRALAGGYSFVEQKYAQSLGQHAMHRQGIYEGSEVSLIVSRGEPVYRAYLMELPLKFHKKDQKAKAQRINKSEEAEPLESGGITYGTGVTTF